MQTSQSKSSEPHKASPSPETILGHTREEKHVQAQRGFALLSGQTPSNPNPFVVAQPKLGIPIQTKLTIGEPNDIYEQEADQMAEQVVGQLQTQPIQKKCASCQAEEKIQRVSLAEQISPIHSSSLHTKPCTFCQTKSEPSSTSDNIERQIQLSKGGGLPMDHETQSSMSQGFGADFSGVRIHTNAQAVQLNQELGAKAFTTGQDIYFNQGEYNPGSNEGKKLLAHELTHTIQQGAIQSKVQRSLLIQKTGSGDPLCYRNTTPEPSPSAREPELHPTYEQWLASFQGMSTFRSREHNRFRVLGDEAAGNYGETGLSSDEAPVERTVLNSSDTGIRGDLRPGEEFIDHPTNRWVSHCLPPNLRATAYQLPSDCADISVILRHVWLAAHNRTERYNGWTVGDGAGGANQRRARSLIRNVSSGNIRHMVNPYTSGNRPIITFSALENLLHPGDILVWEHQRIVEQTRRGRSSRFTVTRTGGHVQTLSSTPSQGGRFQVLQGNLPIFGSDRTRIIQETQTAHPDWSERRVQRHVDRNMWNYRNVGAGRRIEVSRPISSEDIEVPPKGESRRRRSIWGRFDSGAETRGRTITQEATVIVAAGPPRAAARPRAQRDRSTRRRVRRITDWISSINRFRNFRVQSSRSGATLRGIWEAALHEMRSLLERDQSQDENQVSEAQAQALGTAAGNRIKRLLIGRRRSFSDISSEAQAAYQAEVSHFLGVIQAMVAGANTNTQNVNRLFGELRQSFEQATRVGPSPASESESNPVQLKLMSTGSPQIQKQPSPSTPFTQSRITLLRDFRDLYPNLNPSGVTSIPATLIMQTREFQSLSGLGGSGSWQSNYHLSHEEAIQVCRLILQDIITHNYAQPMWHQPGYVRRFVEQVAVNPQSSTEETQYGNASTNPHANLAVHFPPYHTLLSTFQSNLQGITQSSAFAPLVRQFAQDLWNLGRQERNQNNPNDRGLYFTRIQARVLLRTNTLLRASSQGIRQMRSLMETLERVSRGMEDIQFPAQANARILISGFDPFQVSSQNPHSNPSGIIAQSLDGTSLTYSHQGNNQTAHIEAVTFPVTYSAFDRGMVETLFDPYMNPANGHNIKAVITISLNSGRMNFYELERHAGGYRGGYGDNQRIETPAPGLPGVGSRIRVIQICQGIINQTLQAYQSSTNSPNWTFITRQIINRIKAVFNSLSFSGQPALPTLASRTNVEHFFAGTFIPWLETQHRRSPQRLLPSPGEGASNPEFYSTTMNLGAVANQSTASLDVRDDQSYEYFNNTGPQQGSGASIPAAAQQEGRGGAGSGGDYLSNEIYYRTSSVGARYGRAVPNVHMHVPENANVSQVQQIIRLIIEHGI